MSSVEVRDDGRAIVLGQFLRDLLAIHEHYKRRDERLVALVGDRYGDSPTYEASVSRDRETFEVEVEVDGPVVRERSRANF